MIHPNAFPERCHSHGLPAYAASVACPECRKQIKAWLLWAVFQFSVEFDTIVFTGSSGAAFGYWLADELELKIFDLLKNPGHGSVARAIDPYAAPRNWLFLDDFIGRGLTLNRCIELIKHQPSAVLLYCEQHSSGADQFRVPMLARNWAAPRIP